MRTRAWMLLAVSLAALIVVTLLALNMTGVALIPTGPLGDHQPAIPDIAVSTVNYDPQRTSLYMTALVENIGPVPATVVRVTPIGTTVPGSVEVLGSHPFNSDDRTQYGANGIPLIMLGLQPDPGPGWALPEPATGVAVDPKGAAQYQGRAFLVRITPDPTRVTVVLRFDVEYTIGPLHFLTTAWGPVGTTVVMCGPDRPLAGMVGCEAR